MSFTMPCNTDDMRDSWNCMHHRRPLRVSRFQERQINQLRRQRRASMLTRARRRVKLEEVRKIEVDPATEKYLRGLAEEEVQSEDPPGHRSGQALPYICAL